MRYKLKYPTKLYRSSLSPAELPRQEVVAVALTGGGKDSASEFTRQQKGSKRKNNT